MLNTIKIFGVLALSLSISTMVHAQNDDTSKNLMIDCQDKKGTTVQVYSNSDGDLYGPPYTNNVTLEEAVNSNIRVEIRYGNDEYTYAENILTVADGAGQVALQGFATDGLGVFAEVFNFYFEHEGWYLVGDFTIPGKDYRGVRDYREGDLYTFNSPNKMKCNLPYL